MNIRQYLDSTYLKTPLQAGITESESIQAAKEYIQEAISEHFKLIMIRPDRVNTASRNLIRKKRR